MEPFTIRVAGLTVGIHAQYPQTRALCAAYLCQAAPELWVRVGPAQLAVERENTLRTALREQQRYDLSEPALEATAVYRQIGEALPARGGLVFHGSAVAVDGRTYLFTAKSGTGKSTHTALWRRAFGPRAQMINDDKPILRMDEHGVFWVYGTPWNGKHHLSTNTRAPLCGLAVLQRGAQNQIEPLSAAAAWPMLLQQSYRPQDPQALQQTLALLDRLAACTPLYRLHCNMEPEAALVAYRAMAHTPQQGEQENEAES